MSPPVERYPDALESSERGRSEVRKEETPFTRFDTLEAQLRDLEIKDFSEARRIRELKTLNSLYCNEHVGKILQTVQERQSGRLISEQEAKSKWEEGIQKIIENLSMLGDACARNNLDTKWGESLKDENGDWDPKKVSNWAVDVYEFHRKIFDREER